MGDTTGPSRGIGRAAAAVLTLLVAVGCAPLGSGSETVERPDYATGPPPLVLGDGSTEVLGIARSAADPAGTDRIVEPVPVSAAPLLTPTTTAAPAPPPAPSTSAPAPPGLAAPSPTAPTEVPPVQLQGIVIPPLGPNAARAVERLTRPESRDVAGRALGLISFDWRNGLPGWELRFLDGRSGYRGLTYPDASVIEVFVRPGDTAEGLAHVVAHEMGHAVDVARLSDTDRAAWAAARGYGAQVSWWVSSGGSDFASGSGDFAESFAWWQAAVGQWFGDLAGPPDALQTALLARLTYGP